MRRRLLATILFGAYLSLPGLASPGDPRLVLVASAKSSLSDLSPATVRRLYLGLPIVHDGHQPVEIGVVQ